MTGNTISLAELQELSQGAAEILPHGGLEAKLKAREGRPLRIKLGFDPTKPDLHIGHAVVLHALRRFQAHGHHVIVIIGDFTARIGDPTGKDVTRPPLSPEEVSENAKTYLEQLGLILDLSRTEVRYNSEWLDAMTLSDGIKLAAQTTVAQMLARDNFSKRFERNDPIALHEFLYPLLQGYDSVAIAADIELGGTDQRFNVLMGRQIQESYGKDPQIVMVYPILEGTDGVQKMSKSLGNTIGLTDLPEDMYGKVMSIPDSLLENYFRLASGMPLHELTPMLARLQSGELHPRDAKMQLARSIVQQYHGSEGAKKGEEAFIRQFQQHQLPEDLPEIRLEAESMPLATLLVQAKLTSTSSEARRLVQQGGVKIHRQGEPEIMSDPLAPVMLEATGFVLQVGKRRFARILRG